MEDVSWIKVLLTTYCLLLGFRKAYVTRQKFFLSSKIFLAVLLFETASVDSYSKNHMPITVPE